MIECSICQDTVKDVDEAIKDGWIPQFWAKQTSISKEQPVDRLCSPCTVAFTELGQDQEFVLAVTLDELGVVV